MDKLQIHLLRGPVCKTAFKVKQYFPHHLAKQHTSFITNTTWKPTTTRYWKVNPTELNRLTCKESLRNKEASIRFVPLLFVNTGNNPHQGLWYRAWYVPVRWKPSMNYHKPQFSRHATHLDILSEKEWRHIWRRAGGVRLEQRSTNPWRLFLDKHRKY